MLKPVQEGSSLGVSKCRTWEQLESALDSWAGRVRRHVRREVRHRAPRSPWGLSSARRRLEALPILQLVPKNEFYDYEAKYTEGMTEFILPARLEPAVYARAQEAAIAVFQAIGCRGYSRVDMMVDADGTPWFVEVNTLPGMTELSDLPAQARAAGISYEELVETAPLPHRERGLSTRQHGAAGACGWTPRSTPTSTSSRRRWLTDATGLPGP